MDAQEGIPLVCTTRLRHREQDVFPKAVLEGWAGSRSHGSSAPFKEPVLGGSYAALCQVLAGQRGPYL